MKLNFGHVIPVSKRWDYTIDNIRPICKSCNRDMATKHMYTYMIKNNKNGCKNLTYDEKIEFS